MTTIFSIEDEDLKSCIISIEGGEDNIKGLINFVRGEDYFNYGKDCKLSLPRKKIRIRNYPEQKNNIFNLETKLIRWKCSLPF